MQSTWQWLSEANSMDSTLDFHALLIAGFAGETPPAFQDQWDPRHIPTGWRATMHHSRRSVTTGRSWLRDQWSWRPRSIWQEGWRSSLWLHWKTRHQASYQNTYRRGSSQRSRIIWGSMGSKRWTLWRACMSTTCPQESDTGNLNALLAPCITLARWGCFHAAVAKGSNTNE